MRTVKIPNSGAYEWTPTTKLAAGTNYAIQIVAAGTENYSAKFTIKSSGEGVPVSKAPVPSSSTTTSSKAASSTGGSSVTTVKNNTTTESSTSKPSEITSAEQKENSGVKMSSHLALIVCLVAGLVYLH